jgi:hypothetical protein
MQRWTVEASAFRSASLTVRSRLLRHTHDASDLSAATVSLYTAGVGPFPLRLVEAADALKDSPVSGDPPFVARAHAYRGFYFVAGRDSTSGSGGDAGSGTETDVPLFAPSFLDATQLYEVQVVMTVNGVSSEVWLNATGLTAPFEAPAKTPEQMQCSYERDCAAEQCCDERCVNAESGYYDYLNQLCTTEWKLRAMCLRVRWDRDSKRMVLDNTL